MLGLRIVRTQAWLATQAKQADTMAAKMIGLLKHRSLPAGEALIIPGCRSIHTWGMRFPIDVIFVDRAWQVVALERRIGPCRLIGPAWRAWAAVEVTAGTIEQTGVRLGDRFELVPV